MNRTAILIHTALIALFAACGGSEKTTSAADPGAATSLRLEVGPEMTAGGIVLLTVTALDRLGNRAPGYTGTVRVTTSDTAVAPIGNLVFGAKDLGQRTMPLALLTAGTQTVVAEDVTVPGLRSSALVRVRPPPVTRYYLSPLPSSATAGEMTVLTVIALDSHGNLVPDYAGRAHFSSSDPTAQLPADGGFTFGVKQVSVSIQRAGSQTVTVSEVGGTVTATTNAVHVSAAAASRLAVTGPGSVVAGASATYQAAAFDAYGNAATSYRGTVHVSSDDAAAALPANFAFDAATPGVKSFAATLGTAGIRTLTVADVGAAGVRGSLTVTVSSGAAVALALSNVPASVRAGDAFSATVTASDAYGNVAVGYAGTVSFTSSDGTAALPGAYAFRAADEGRHAFSFILGTAGTSILTVTDGARAASLSIGVSHGPVARLEITDLPASTRAGASLTATITARDRFGNLATGYTGTLHTILTDARALPVADRAASAGRASISFELVTTGLQSILVSDSANGVSASAEISVGPAAASHYALAPLPAVAVAGEPLSLSAVALDDFGNADGSYAGTGHVSGSTGDRLPADTAFSAGRLSVGISFTRIGSHKVTLSEVGGIIFADSSSVNVTSDDASAIDVTPAGATATAGEAAAFTGRAADRWGNTVASYAGTVDFTSTDAAFGSPGPTAFGAADQGSHLFSVTFKTAGSIRLDVRDVGNGSIKGGASWTVVPAAASACSIDGAPTAAPSGTSVAFRVSLRDAFSNQATNYGGTIAVASSDAGATFPVPSVTYDPAVDRGAHEFTVQFSAAGLRSLTATDSAASIRCSRDVDVLGPAVHYVLSMPADVNVGGAANVVVSVQDAFNQPLPAYAGTIVFTSSDTRATLPAPVTLDGSQNGTATVQIVFGTVGVQVVTARQQDHAEISGSTSTQVHGLVYTDPPAGVGSVRLVANAAASTPGRIQLDLVAAKQVLNGYGIGLNLPASTTQVLPDDQLLTNGNVFEPGPAVGETKAIAASLTMVGSTANVLYTGVSTKPGVNTAGAAIRVSDVGPINSGAKYYSIRLKLNPTAAPGIVFDGAIAMGSFRAALRDRMGNDTVPQSEFAIGRLEVR